MLTAGPAFKVTILLNGDTGSPDGFLHIDILRFLHAEQIAGATAFRAYAGFGAHGRLHTQDEGSVGGEYLPVMIQFIDAEERVRAILPQLLELVTDGLVEVHATEVVKLATAQARVIS